jgi:RNA polymerase sigma-70 factor (ECF subfamily)
MTDQELIERILTRDKAALLYFYRTYAPKLKKFIMVKIAVDQDVEEVLQDTLCAFLDALRDYHGEAKMTTYLYSICQHKIIDYYRRKKVKHLVFSRLPGLEHLVSPLMSPEEHFDRSVVKEQLRETFRRILPKYASILRMKYVEDRSVSDIASFFSQSLKATESLLFRARKAFVDAYRNE